MPGGLGLFPEEFDHDFGLAFTERKIGESAVKTTAFLDFYVDFDAGKADEGSEA